MRTGLVAFASADGIHWRKLRDDPVFPPTKQPSFDSQNLAFWSESEQKYVAYYRTFKTFPGLGRVRWITRATSDDFLRWSAPQEMSFGDAPPEHLYINQTSPYFRAPHIYVSIAARFWPGRRALTDEEIAQAGIMEGYYKDISDVVLFTTRGGTRYDRTFLESFVRPGPGPNNWASRTNYPVLNVVQTGPDGDVVLRQSRLCAAHRARHPVHASPGWIQLGSRALRRRRNADAHARPSAERSSKSITRHRPRAASAWKLQDASGNPLPGFTLADSQEIIGDHIARVVAWKSGSSVAALAGKPVRLRFVMKDADLYSIRFRN